MNDKHNTKYNTLISGQPYACPVVNVHISGTKMSIARVTRHRGSIPGRSRPFRDGWQAYKQRLSEKRSVCAHICVITLFRLITILPQNRWCISRLLISVSASCAVVCITTSLLTYSTGHAISGLTRLDKCSDIF